MKTLKQEYLLDDGGKYIVAYGEGRLLLTLLEAGPFPAQDGDGIDFDQAVFVLALTAWEKTPTGLLSLEDTIACFFIIPPFRDGP